MPEISLLQPSVFLGLIEKAEPPNDFVGLRRIFNDRDPSLDTVAEWDVIVGNREVAAPNVPNSEAHIVPQLGLGRKTASYVYLREKKVFKPTTTRWLRAPGSRARARAEENVAREVADLDRRFDAFAEWTVWQALKGTIVFNYPDVKATVDYGVPASHKPVVTTSWATATPAQLISMVNAWKRLMSLDAQTPATDVWLNGATFDRLAIIFANNPEILSDRQKDQLNTTGVVQGLLGLNWNIYDLGYTDSAGVEQRYIADDSLFITSGANRAFYLREGPSADHDAPQDHTGKFVKSWVTPDPSGRQHLEEWYFLPIIERVEQIIYVQDVAP